VNLTEWGKSVKVAPNEVKFASTWHWSSFSNLWRAYKIIVEFHTQQNSPHGFTVKKKIFIHPIHKKVISIFKHKSIRYISKEKKILHLGTIRYNSFRRLKIWKQIVTLVNHYKTGSLSSRLKYGVPLTSIFSEMAKGLYSLAITPLNQFYSDGRGRRGARKKILYL